MWQELPKISSRCSGTSFTGTLAPRSLRRLPLLVWCHIGHVTPQTTALEPSRKGDRNWGEQEPCEANQYSSLPTLQLLAHCSV